MIELIFAIVVMGIALMSAPTMISTSVKSSSVAFEQESIAIAAAHANSLMSYAWDEQNTESQAANQQNIILTTQSTDAELNVRNASETVAGRKRHLSATVPPIAASAVSLFGAGKDRELNGQFEPVSDKDDIDDFDGDLQTLTLIDAGSSAQRSDKGNYMDTSVVVTTNVGYINDNANYNACTNNSNGCAFSNPFNSTSPTTTNIKAVKVNLTSNNTDTDITLKLFMCNIGGATPDTRGGY